MILWVVEGRGVPLRKNREGIELMLAESAFESASSRTRCQRPFNWITLCLFSEFQNRCLQNVIRRGWKHHSYLVISLLVRMHGCIALSCEVH